MTASKILNDTPRSLNDRSNAAVKRFGILRLFTAAALKEAGIPPSNLKLVSNFF
jgi:hypothetical protein